MVGENTVEKSLSASRATGTFLSKGSLAIIRATRAVFTETASLVLAIREQLLVRQL
jgi:hypothetical protein